MRYVLVILILRVLGDVDLASTHSGRNNMLSCGFAILHVGDLCRRMATSLSHSLNCGYYFLVFAILVVRNECFVLCFDTCLVFIDLQLEHSLIWSSSSTIWTPVNALTGLVVHWSFAGRLIRHLWLSTLGRIYSAGNWPLWGILITDL